MLDTASLENFKNLRRKYGGDEGCSGKGNKVIGFYCTYCPREIIMAAGAIPVGLCGPEKHRLPLRNGICRNLCP